MQDDGGILGMDGFFGTEGGGHVNTLGGTINAGISLRGGDDRVNIALGGTLSSLDAGDGGDRLTLGARVIQDVEADGGDDRLAVAVGHLDTGIGDDVLALSAVFVNGVDLGEGDHRLTLSAAVANGVHGGGGADHLAVSVERLNHALDAGGGDDTVTLMARGWREADGRCGRRPRDRDRATDSSGHGRR